MGNLMGKVLTTSWAGTVPRGREEVVRVMSRNLSRGPTRQKSKL